MPEVSVLIEGGKATPAPPLGPALAPLGVNVGKIVTEINTKTKDFTGMKVPITIKVDNKTKEYEIEVGSPPASALIMKEAKAEKGAANPKTEIKGNLSIAQLKKVAEQKIVDLNSSKIKSAMCEMAGTCKQMGITIEGGDPREAIKKIKAGEYDKVIGE